MRDNRVRSSRFLAATLDNFQGPMSMELTFLKEIIAKDHTLVNMLSKHNSGVIEG
jgi:hypothetical protein